MCRQWKQYFPVHWIQSIPDFFFYELKRAWHLYRIKWGIVTKNYEYTAFQCVLFCSAVSNLNLLEHSYWNVVGHHIDEYYRVLTGNTYKVPIANISLRGHLTLVRSRAVQQWIVLCLHRWKIFKQIHLVFLTWSDSKELVRISSMRNYAVTVSVHLFPFHRCSSISSNITTASINLCLHYSW